MEHPRLYLTGKIVLETDRGTVDERAFPGRQGGLALVYLALERHRPVPRDELADALWGDALPAAWETALSSVISKLRGLLDPVGLSGPDTLTTAAGCHRLELPPGSWIDIEAAVNAVDEAEGALRRNELEQAWPWATVAQAIARRPLLAGEDAPWIDQARSRLRRVLVRALDSLAEVWTARREWSLAVAVAEEAVELEPFREGGHRRLMRTLAAAGDRAQAVRAYERCRSLLAEELGVDPSPQTQEVYLELLRAGGG